MTIRLAAETDLAALVALSALKRQAYAEHSPDFWRAAQDADAQQLTYFASLITRQDWICLVHENQGSRRIDGFIMGRIIEAPPVYAPGGTVCMVDDFVVADVAMWSTLGAALQTVLSQLAIEKGCVLSISVAGAHDAPKREMLRAGGAHVASEWYVKSLGDGGNSA